MSRNTLYYAVALAFGAALVATLVLVLRGGLDGAGQGAGQVEDIYGILVEPGTEILFELSRPVDPRSVAERHKFQFQGLDAEIIPPTPPSDGKYPGGGGRWQGFGVVWASKTHLLYVAPDVAGPMFDEVRLEPADFPKNDAEQMSLMVQPRGGDDEWLNWLRRLGFRELAQVRREWLGKGDIRLRVVATRSREEAGRDRPLPPKAFDLVTPDEYENGKLVEKGCKPLYIHPGKPFEARGWPNGSPRGCDVDKPSRPEGEKR